MNLKDMQLLIEMIKQVDNAVAQIEVGGNFPKHVQEIQVAALARYRRTLIHEFEERHEIRIDI